jgi:hypothetical protein
MFRNSFERNRKFSVQVRCIAERKTRRYAGVVYHVNYKNQVNPVENTVGYQVRFYRPLSCQLLPA